jgi:ABC-type multidrug transport system fused ATPase/permease subunit
MNYTIGFWYGSILVSRQEYNESTHDFYSVSDVIVIFFTVYTSNLNLGRLPDCLTAFEMGRKSTAKIFSIIDRKSLIKDG